MPKDTAEPFFRACHRLGGLGIPQLQYKVPLDKAGRFAKYCDNLASGIIKNNALPTTCRKLDETTRA